MKKLVLKPMKPFWVVIDSLGNVRGHTASKTQRDSIKAFMSFVPYRWTYWHNIGFDCVRVIEDVKK